MNEALSFLFSLALATPLFSGFLPPGKRPARAEAERMRAGWNDLEKRAAAFRADPEVARALRGGGSALDRHALFAAAERALDGAADGFSLLFADPSDELLSWAGRAPAALPRDPPRGGIWSADFVLFYETFSVSLPQEKRAGRLTACWRVSRRRGRFHLFPGRGASWKEGEDGRTWGALESLPEKLREDGPRRSPAPAAFLGAAALLLVLSMRLGRGLAVARKVLSLVCFLLGVTGALVELTPQRRLEAFDYLREPAALLAFAMSLLAAALFASGTRASGPNHRAAALFALGAFLAGTAGSSLPAAVAASALLSLISLWLASSAQPRPLGILAAAALAGAALFGPLALAREAAHRRVLRRQIQQQLSRPVSPEEVEDQAASRLPAELSRVSALLQGAPQQDLTDIAFTLWKGTGLAGAAPVSGIRLWHEGRVVSRFAFGIPSESKDEVVVGEESVRILRRKIPLEAQPSLAAGESPDEADLEVGDWPSWRPLPSPLAEYRELLTGSAEAPGGEELSLSGLARRGRGAEAVSVEVRGESFSEKILEAFAASTAAFLAILLLAAAGAAARHLLSGHAAIRLRPATFRGRITGLFTILVLVPFVAAAIFIRETVAGRLRRETVMHAQTALATARTVLDDYLSAAGTSVGRRQLIDDELVSWMARVVGHDLSIYTEGTVDSTSRRELFASDLLSERLSGSSLGRLLVSRGGPVVESRVLQDRAFDQVQATLASLPGPVSPAGPAVLSIPLLPQQRETEQEIARLSATLTAFTLLVFGLSVLLGTRTAYRVTGPIGDLVEGTHAVARGERPSVPVPSDTELKRLVEAFLSMAATLESQREGLARANRLRAWAEMARIIAHEVKNPLTPIRLSAEHLLEVWRRGDPEAGRVLEECVRNILVQTETLQAIASEFSDYSRLPEPQREQVDLARLVDSAISSFAAAPAILWERTVETSTVFADPKLLSRALTNLIGNAVEALREGGRINVSVRRSGTRVVFRVEDDGPGVPEEALAKLFEPYFSTKSAGGGLGLAIVRKIAQEHGGDARAEKLRPRGFGVEFDVEDSKEV